MKFIAIAIRFLAALFRILPSSDRVALLSRQGHSLSLDYRLLADELKKHLPEEKIVTCLSEPETKGFVYFAWESTKQLWYASTSRVCVLDGYSVVICVPPAQKGRTVIQLWHALGAVKCFGLQSLDTPSGRSSKVAEIGRMHRNYDWIIAAGPGACEVYSEAFGYPEDSVLPFGMPRIDYLLDSSLDSPRKKVMNDIKESHPYLADGKRNILYAPTFRKGEHNKNWFSEELESLAQEFSADDTNLIVAGHPLDQGFEADLFNRYPVIKSIPHASTIDLLGFADCVVTDYSAIAFEAALLRLNVYFYVPDVNEYCTSPGLNINPMVEFPSVSAIDAPTLAAIINQGDISPSDNPFLRFADKYFEGIGYGCTERLARFICEELDVSKRM